MQFPPTETALMILLRRCGVDVDQFGTDRYRTLKEFWLDLTAKEHAKACGQRLLFWR